MAFVWSILEALELSLGSIFFRITDVAWPLSHMFMLVVGIFVLKAGVSRGWRKLPPFLCGLALPVTFAIGAVGGISAGGVLFGVMTAAGFMSMGYAVCTSSGLVNS